MRIASTQFNLEHGAFEIYFSGCTGNCNGCHNPELKDFDVGETLTIKMRNNIVKQINDSKPLVEFIWILGGEPLDQNFEDLYYFLQHLKIKTKLDIVLFTHYEIDEIPLVALGTVVDYIKTGEYKKELEVDDNIQYNIKLPTSNQNIYRIEEVK